MMPPGVIDPGKLWDLFTAERQRSTALEDQVDIERRMRLVAESKTLEIRDKCEKMMKKWDEMLSKREVVVQAAVRGG